ncbi:MAG: DUF1786 domain-containing protein [Methanosarcina sp.]
MLILAADVGTGTQDILLFDSEKEVENSLFMVVPAPTQIIGKKIAEATRKGEAIVLTGTIKGGGPSTFAIRKHLEAGNSVYSTEKAALTIHDNLERVKNFGIQIVSSEKAKKLVYEENAVKINMQDFDPELISSAFSIFEVPMPQNYAIAVQDHGNAPAKSNRIYRFELFRELIDKGGELKNFVFKPEEIPQAFTRMKAQADILLETGKNLKISSEPIEKIIDSTHEIRSKTKLEIESEIKSKIESKIESGIGSEIKSVFMDTGPAAIFGALSDPAAKQPAIVINIGNGHTLGALVQENRITALFEHHSSLMNPQKLQDYIIRLADGKLGFEEVFADEGHGAYIKEFPGFDRVRSIMVTGPKREMLEKLSDSEIKPEILKKLYFAAPFGSMMLSGCFGLLAGFFEKYPDPSIKLINH